MKSLFMLQKTLIALLLLLVINCSKDSSVNSQIVGNWKFTNIYVKEGTKPETDQFLTLASALPCVKEIVFIFKKNGDVTSTSPADCQSTANNIVGSTGTSKYELKDNKLIITDKNPLTFDITFSGKTMTWKLATVNGTVTTTTRFVFAQQ
jgi:hypothetical protein